MKISKTLSAALVLTAMASAPTQAQSRAMFTYEVEVTNITAGMNFTPILTIAHNSRYRLFTLGEMASAPLADLAENGSPAMLRAAALADSNVSNAEPGSGLTMPGKMSKITITARPGDRLSIASMLVPSNDAFVAVRGIELPWNGSDTYEARAYDAGSEANAETCASVAGPNIAECGGAGGGNARIGGGEGFAHVHRGITGAGELNPSVRTWLNPVALVRVTRVR